MPQIIRQGDTPVTSPAVAELDELRRLWREYGQPAVIGLALALAFVIGFLAYRTWRQNQQARASELLARAQSPAQLQEIVDRYGSTAAAPLAMLALAAQQFEAGQYELARYTYAQFEKKFPRHPMRTATQLGQIQCLEAVGQFDEALREVQAFLETHPDDYLTPMAQLVRARILLQSGRLEEARAAYEDFVVQYADTDWRATAESALNHVNRLLRAASKNAPSPTP